MVTTAKSLNGLDFSNVIQDSQTIASQTTLETLLITAMKTCAKYTGAQKGLLLLNENGQLQIKAIFTNSADEILVLEAIPSKTSENFPQTIIDNVYKSNGVVTLNFTDNELDIAGDPYLLQYQPSLICCAPIYYQDDQFGVMYLESSADSVGFGPENIETLQTLLTQTAISLRNIKTYTQTEQGANNTDYSLLFEHAPTGCAYAQIIVDKNGNPIN